MGSGEEIDPETEALYRLNEIEQYNLKDKLAATENPRQRREIIENYLKFLQESDLATPKVEFGENWQWFNVKSPVKTEHINGRISVLDFFTYCCINCMHVLSDLEALESTFPNVLIIGVHSAKFENERVSDNIARAVQRYGIRHPVVNDSTAFLWQKFVISCWPTFLVLDPNGRPIMHFVGENHRESLMEFVSVATEFYSNPKTEPIPLPDSQFGTQTLEEKVLSFPGKIDSFKEKIYIADSANHRIVISDSAGRIHSIIGRGERGFSDGNFQKVKFNSPQGLCRIGDELYVCDTGNHALRICNLQSGIVTTAAGSGNQGHDLTGGKSGPEQELASPWGICSGLSPDGGKVLFIAMAGSHQIWAYALQDVQFWRGVGAKAKGTLFAVAGSGTEENRNTSYPLKAGFAQPSGLAFDHETSTLYIADSESSSIRKLASDGSVKNVVGAARDPTNLFAFGDTDGLGIDAKLQHPLGIAFVPEKQVLIVADSYNHKLKVISDLDKKNPKCKTLTCSGFDEPGGLCYDSESKTVFVANTNKHGISKLTLESPEIVTELDITAPDCVDSTDFKSITKDNAVRISTGKFTVELVPSNDLIINDRAPNSWSLKLPDNLRSDRISGVATLPTFDLDVQPLSEQMESLFRLDLKVFLCDSKSNTCTVQSKSVPVLISPHEEGMSSVKIAL